MFGFPVEGFIGTTDQKKGLEDNWIDCFLNLRIIPQLLFLKSTTLDKEIINKVKEKIKSELLNHKPINALVHGDLWSCLLYTSPSPRDRISSRMPSSA